LSGEIFIYNLKDMKKIGSLKQDKVVSFEWSPSGKYFLLATTFPRLRVDN
jgi:translation initiation factor 2A